MTFSYTLTVITTITYTLVHELRAAAKFAFVPAQPKQNGQIKSRRGAKSIVGAVRSTFNIPPLSLHHIFLSSDDRGSSELCYRPCLRLSGEKKLVECIDTVTEAVATRGRLERTPSSSADSSSAEQVDICRTPCSVLL